MAAQKFPVTMEKSDGTTKVAYTKADVVQGEWDGFALSDKPVAGAAKTPAAKATDTKATPTE